MLVLVVAACNGRFSAGGLDVLPVDPGIDAGTDVAIDTAVGTELDAAIDAGAAVASCQPSLSPAAGASKVGVFSTIEIELAAPPAADAQIELLAPHATRGVP